MKKILLADDSRNFCELTKNFLEQHKNYQVDIALTLDELITHLKKTNNYSAILLDLWFPHQTIGSQALEYCVSNHPAIPVISISGTASPETAVQSIQKGACDFIEKPFKIDRLLITLQNAIEKFEVIRQFKECQIKAINMVGNSPVMQDLYNSITLAAQSDCSVLISGETGTGKELVANAIHKLSNRCNNNLVSINCSAIPRDLLESELFGHSKGAFTGAVTTQVGLAEQANNGTLFLDEIEEFPLNLQARVLRFLESGTIQPIGCKAREVNSRIISASNKDIMKLVEQKVFREDLYYRIHEFEIRVPPLRDHKEDIPQLVLHFIDKFCKKQHIPTKQISRAALSLLMDQQWPGNVRQLKNIVRRSIMHSQQRDITAKHIEVSLMTPLHESHKTLREAIVQFEKEYITKHLVLSDWNVNHTASLLGLDRSNLYKKIHIHQIELR